MATPYQQIAKSALMNWIGLSEAEADQKIATESVMELENQVYAMDSIKSALIGLAKVTQLLPEEAAQLTSAVINGPEDAEIFNIVAAKAMSMSESDKLDILTIIHDGWVQKNCSEKTFNKKVGREQLRQYAPLELIGWNEVKSDLLFLTPILNSVGVSVDEETLSAAYHQRVSAYMEEHAINGPSQLQELVGQGKNYYSALPDDLHDRLQPYTETVTNQIIKNWNDKDKATAEIFSARQNSTGQSNK